MTYLWAGYLITWLALAGYAWRLGRRVSDAGERLRGLRHEGPSAPDAD